MDPAGKTFTSEGANPRQWIGRIIMAVILGEAIWNLIVSVMNNLVVPWLGDLFGQSSGLPTSFTQRPYDYPDLFVSVLEFCIAGLVAAILNYFFQRPQAVRVKQVNSPAPVEPMRIVPESAAPERPPVPTTQPAMPPPPAPIQTASTQFATTQPALIQPATTRPAPGPAAMAAAPPAPVPRWEQATPPAPVATTPAAPPPPVAPASVAKPLAVAPTKPPVTNSVSTPLPPPPKTEPAKSKKPKEVYYNIVGEPMPSDDD